MKLFLIRLGEISLKGLNRGFFEKKLKNNIKLKLHPVRSYLIREKGRFFLYVDGSCPDSRVESILGTTFGVVGFSRALVVEKDWSLMVNAARKLMESEPFSNGLGSFRVQARRSDKNFEMRSVEIEQKLGGVVLERHPGMTVNLKNPEQTLYVEVREKAYLYTSPLDGPGGLPVSSAGKGLLLLSGGIDSPVAGWKMAKRGLNMDCLYFHAYPYTSDSALQKVKDLAVLLGPWLQGTNLIVVNFTQAELWIRDHSREEEHTLMMRACMMKVANAVAQSRNARVLVTGEALGQVASQTLESICFTDSMSMIPVLRPLIGMDKNEIVDVARKIGTYETSILPYDDCCVIFSPRHPLVKPTVEGQTKSYERMGIDEILEKCVKEAEQFPVNYI